MSSVTFGQRQTIVSWWIFKMLDSTPYPEPKDVLAWIEQAEDDLEEFDMILEKEYTEYVRQL